MKKLTKLFILPTTLLLILVGCTGNNNENTDTDVSVDELISQIKEQIIEDLMDDGADEEDVTQNGELNGYIEANLLDEDEAEFYIESIQLDTDQLDEGTVLASMMNVNSNAIFVLKAKEQEDVPYLEEALERELENQTKTWEQYLPDQHEKVKNNIITTNGKYLLYVTYEYPEKIADIFKNNL